MCPQDAGTRLGRHRDVTSEPVRQADERSEGTTQRVARGPPDVATPRQRGHQNTRLHSPLLDNKHRKIMRHLRRRKHRPTLIQQPLTVLA